MSVSEAPTVEAQVSALIALAAQALRAGRPADAVPPLSEAAGLRPSDAALQHDLGLALLEVGRVVDAVGALQRAVAVDPRYADAWFRLGIALEKLGDAVPAVRAYARATELAPSLTEAWFRAGALVHTAGHRDEAIGCFRRAAATGPKTRFGRLGAARALITEERDDEAERVLRKAVAVDPDNALAHDLLGNLLAERGRFDEAYGCFTSALTIAPLLAGSYYDLVRCRPVTPADQGLLARMQSSLATPGLDPGQCQRVHLALGKAADDLGDFALAMRHFDAADALRPGSAAFDAAAFDTEAGRIMARCTPELIGQASALGNGDATPIFIIGMPRSGTTLVEQIISSHPDVCAGGELNFWNERGAAWHHRRWDASQGSQRSQGLQSSEAAAGMAEAAATDPRFLRQAATDYLRLLRSIGRKSLRVTDKMPFNFIWAGLIHLAFPRATIIHCRRAPIDTALSIHQTLFHPDLAFPTGGAKLVAYFRSYARLTDHWRRVLPPSHYIEVDYDQLTRAPELAIRRIVDGCGLTWNDACLTPQLNPRAVRTPSKWQTRQPINRNSVDRWKRYAPYLGPLRELLDDPLLDDPLSVHAR
jgi:tetratricopeptide (TPR) repeat protein